MNVINLKLNKKCPFPQKVLYHLGLSLRWTKNTKININTAWRNVPWTTFQADFCQKMSKSRLNTRKIKLPLKKVVLPKLQHDTGPKNWCSLGKTTVCCKSLFNRHNDFGSRTPIPNRLFVTIGLWRVLKVQSRPRDLPPLLITSIIIKSNKK